MGKPGKGQGQTLMELMLSVAVVGVLVGTAVPALNAVFERQHLKGAAEGVAASARIARNAAESHGVPVTVSVVAGEAWCVGLSDAGGCDCTRRGDNGAACRVADTEFLLDGGRFDGVSLAGEDFAVTFTPGLEASRSASENWQVVLESGSGRRVGVAMTLLGAVYLCQPTRRAAGIGARECPE